MSYYTTSAEIMETDEYGRNANRRSDDALTPIEPPAWSGPWCMCGTAVHGDVVYWFWKNGEAK